MEFQILDLLAEHLLLGRIALQRVTLEQCRTETNYMYTQELWLLPCLVTGACRILPGAHFHLLTPTEGNRGVLPHSHTPIPMPSRGKLGSGAGARVPGEWEYLPLSDWCPSHPP